MNFNQLTALPTGKFLILTLLFFANCSADMMDDPELPDEPLAGLSGTLIYPHAGDLFSYDLGNGTIDFVAELKGRQGPFFSPDAAFFTSNNWAGNNEGVAIWSLNSFTVQKEFNLFNTLTSGDLGVRVAPGAALFSGILNPSSGFSEDLTVFDDTGNVLYRLDGDAIRFKGHTWDTNQNLYFTGEIEVGNLNGTKILAKVTDLETSSIEVIRTFDVAFGEVPDELSVSPDGNRIAYNFKSDIWIGATTEDATDHREAFGAVQSLARPVFSPDGTHMAMAMLNSNTSLHGNLHVARIPAEGSTNLIEDGPSMLPGPNSSLNSTWTSGGDSSIGWIR